MKANYHTHTFRCLHASGTEREYIEEAIKGGIRILGFSDHSPMTFPVDYYSGFRMRLDELEDYCDTLTALRKEYESDISIHIGLETEYYPACFETLMEFLKDYPIEYMLQGQHCLNNEYDGVGCGARTEDEELLKQYVDQACTGMRTGRFLYIAHPDIFNFADTKSGIYAQEMRRLCKTAKEMNMPLEINMLGLATGRTYPNPDFWRIAAEEENDVVLGVDCHHTDMMIMPEVEERALGIVRKFNLKLVNELELHF